MGGQNTLVIGIGAQKAGTTWLHSYFSKHPQFYASPIKEINFFSSFLKNEDYPQIRRGFFNRLREHSQSIPDPLTLAYVEKLRNLSDRVLMDSHPETYIDFFEKRVRMETCFGEISPSYADLGSLDFEYVESTYENIKYLFILRDPVKRFESHLRFNLKLDPSLQAQDLKKTALDPDSAFYKRSRYEVTIKALETVVDSSRIKYLFYETMFEKPSILALCTFLGIDYVEPDFTEQVNTNRTVTDTPLTEREFIMIQRELTETYRYCDQRFNEEIPRNWLPMQI